MAERQSVRVGVDVGGTFTDFVLDDGERLHVGKVPSTPRDQSEAVERGLIQLDVEPRRVERFVHGTTVATNAVLERRGARTVFVTTDGVRDLLEIARQNRPNLYDLFADRPEPLVPRDLVVEAAERVSAEGDVIRALEDPAKVAARVRALSPESVAVCLLFSFLRPDHERAIRDALEGLPVSLSSEVLPVFREYERANTTCLNAYVGPVISRYLKALSERLHAAGLPVEPEVMRSGGGTFTASMAAGLPVHTLLSGPAAGAWGAAAVGAAAGYPDLIAFDMGGTSTDATLIEDGRARTSSEGEIGGLPFAVSSTEIHTVGAGGGSIAWRDSGGSLRVGPRSAGADPGPACYGLGGTEPTVTDTYSALGYVDPGRRLGESIDLDVEAASRAIERLASSLRMSMKETARGIVSVTESAIAKALRVVSVERGRDPRRYALLPFGGAGPLHQGPLSRALQCPVVIVPRHPGVLSALGLLAAPIAVDVARTRVLDLGMATAGELEAAWAELEKEGRDLLSRQGIEASIVTRSADCRYHGQAFELEVAADEVASPDSLSAAFHAAHRDRYGYSQAEEAIEAVTFRVRLEGPVPGVSGSSGRPTADPSPRRESRTAVIDGVEQDCAVYERDTLWPGFTFEGPALVESLDSTCLVLAGQKVEVDEAENLIIREG
ncbi:MAG TPA: hydantoinase/oxoprolinase family protein [Actinomycetota bacterium]